MRRYEAIVDAARERSAEGVSPFHPKPGTKLFGIALFALLWWFWLYAVAHILVYVVVLGGPGLGFDETSAFVNDYLRSFDNAIGIGAAVIASVGAALGWLPGTEPGLLRRGGARRRTGPQIVRNVAIGKVVTSVWAAVFVVPLEAFAIYGIVFAGTGLWALVATGFALAGTSIGRWLVVVALILDLVTFIYLIVQIYGAPFAHLPLVQVLGLLGVVLATTVMLAYLLVSSRVNRFFGT